PSALVVTNLKGSGNPDIAVANADSDSVTVFLNNFTNGTPGTFSPGASYAAGRTPIGIVAGNFDQSGRISLAVVNSNQDAGNLYDVTVLPADPAPGNAGKFLAPVSFDTGLVAPTSLAAGAFRQTGRLDLVVGASNGLRLLFNNSSGPGNFN